MALEARQSESQHEEPKRVVRVNPRPFGPMLIEQPDHKLYIRPHREPERVTTSTEPTPLDSEITPLTRERVMSLLEEDGLTCLTLPSGKTLIRTTESFIPGRMAKPPRSEKGNTAAIPDGNGGYKRYRLDTGEEVRFLRKR